MGPGDVLFVLPIRGAAEISATADTRNATEGPPAHPAMQLDFEAKRRIGDHESTKSRKRNPDFLLISCFRSFVFS
jgi:hypothetical protein